MTKGHCNSQINNINRAIFGKKKVIETLQYYIKESHLRQNTQGQRTDLPVEVVMELMEYCVKNILQSR